MSSAGDENEFFAGLSFVLPDRELRVTKRCLVEDLGGEENATLEEVAEHPIVRAFLRERRNKTVGTRDIGQLSSGHEVWVLTQGQRHRGGTWFEEGRGIVWLVAAGHHESGSPDDFYPYCKELDKARRLAPSESDYEGLFVEQDARFAARILIEAPLLRKRAEEENGEVSGAIGGRFGVTVAIEVADDLQEMTVAFDLRSLGVQEYIPAILAALEADEEWEFAEQMPSRPLEYYEQAFSHMSISGMTKRFEIANLIAIRIGIDQHNSNCPIPAEAILLNPVDCGLMGHTRLWGVPVLPDPSVRVKRFRLKCEASPEEIEEELDAYLKEAEEPT